MVFYLIYISQATKLMNQLDLEEIMDESLIWNNTHGITGMLIYIQGRLLQTIEGRFCQVLEGNKEDVMEIFNKIQTDKRHKNILILTEQEIPKRNFETWSMGFKKMTYEDFIALPGYFELNDEFAIGQDKNIGNSALNYLYSFYQVNQQFDY